MRIAIRAEGVKFPRALLESAKSRVSFALARFGEQIGQVTTRFWVPATRMPTGQKYCQIEVELRLPKTLKVETMDADPLVAVDRAANRLARSIIREVTMSRAAPAISAATLAVFALRAKKTSTRQSKARREEPDGIGGTGSRKNRKTTPTTRTKSRWSGAKAGEKR
jgi:ribosome-associated translation inhibitor RaiA